MSSWERERLQQICKITQSHTYEPKYDWKSAMTEWLATSPHSAKRSSFWFPNCAGLSLEVKRPSSSLILVLNLIYYTYKLWPESVMTETNHYALPYSLAKEPSSLCLWLLSLSERQCWAWRSPHLSCSSCQVDGTKDLYSLSPLTQTLEIISNAISRSESRASNQYIYLSTFV